MIKYLVNDFNYIKKWIYGLHGLLNYFFDRYSFMGLKAAVAYLAINVICQRDDDINTIFIANIIIPLSSYSSSSALSSSFCLYYYHY